MLSRSCKHSEYFYKRRHKVLFVTTVYGWTLLTAFIRKSSVVDLAGYPRYTSFASNSKTLKRHLCESIISQ